ncbi:hypothetical protein, partial [Sphingomonas sp. NPDC079357]|uniref:hypothetical protein n=1 Tax=Sphingomonas sp. NPDC079357 TaxID=3364518 RepID=UPI00384E31BC
MLNTSTSRARASATLLGCTMLAGVPLAATAQTRQAASAPARSAATAPVAAPATQVPAIAQPAARTITSLRVEGTQRIEPETALSYTKLRQGDS